MSPRKYAANIRKAIDWLLRKSRRDGLIYSEHPSETARYMEGHGLATIFLAGAFDDETDRERREKLGEVLTRAVKYIEKAQSTQGGWFHTSKVEGHDLDVISATVIQIQALQAAKNAGMPVRSEIASDAFEYLKMAIKKSEDNPKAKQSASRPVDTAAALACRPWQYRLSREEEELNAKWRKYCENEIPAGDKIKLGRDELVCYYFAQATRNRSRDVWTDYRTPLFDHVQNGQNKDGGWPAGDGISVGSVYSTAIWCTVLQLDKDSHPSKQRIPEVRVTRARFAINLVAEQEA